MTHVKVKSIKVTIVFPADAKPDVAPEDPRVMLDMDGLKIQAKVNAKAARKLKAHDGGAVLQGRLVVERGELVLIDAGFTFLEAKPPASSPPAAPESA